MTRAGCVPESVVERLDRAVELGSVEAVALGVKEALVEAVRGGDLRLDSGTTAAKDDCYARRHLHSDPDGRYSIVAMIWGAGQGTPIHDHDDMWCVECVYQGEIVVTSYDVCETDDPNRVGVEMAGETHAALGEAGALIPPFDYHVIENQGQDTAVTIHVYGGEMEGCNVFQPVEGGPLYQRQWKSLTFDE